MYIQCTEMFQRHRQRPLILNCFLVDILLEVVVVTKAGRSLCEKNKMENSLSSPVNTNEIIPVLEDNKEINHIVLFGDHLEKDEEELLSELSSRIPFAKVTKELSPNVTHVVVSTENVMWTPTFNVRSALLNGKVIVSLEWVLDSAYQKVLNHHQSLDVKVEKKDGLPELTPLMLNFIEMAIKEGNSRFFCNANGVTAGDIRGLAGKNWLNDKVINAYMDMLVERGKLEGYPSVYAFSTFFYMRLQNKGYSAVTRWTKMIDIFEQDILLVPLYLSSHWALCVIDFRKKSICYYDSMNAKNHTIHERMLQYLKEEKESKKKECFNESDWVTKRVLKIPQQQNGYDCGVFTCVFAEYLARGAVKADYNNDWKCICSYPPFPFSTENMEYFRKKIIYEISMGRILE